VLQQQGSSVLRQTTTHSKEPSTHTVSSDCGTGKRFLKTKVVSNLRNAVSDNMARGTLFRWKTERQFTVTSKSSLQTRRKLKFDDTIQGSLRFNGTPSISFLPESSPLETEKHLRLSCCPPTWRAFDAMNDPPPTLSLFYGLWRRGGCAGAAHSALALSSLIPHSSEVATKEKFFATMTKPRPEHILPMCGLSLGLGFRVYARLKILNPKPPPEIAKFRRE
jgi:hypothetical protein